MTVRVQLRRGTAAQWTSADPTLASGEMGLETDTGKFKVGDGVSAWGVLPYSSGPAGPAGPIGATGTVAAAGDGTEALPGIAFASDLNTGIYRPGADQLALSTNGTGRLFISSTGNIGVNTPSPLRNLHVTGTSSAVVQLSTSSIACYQAFQNSNSTATNAVQIGAVGTDEFAVHTGNTGEKLRITSAGLVGIGTSSPNSQFEVGFDGVNLVGSISALPTGADNAVFIAKTGLSGSAPFDQIGSIVYRPRVSSVAGRSSHIFYTGSPSTIRMVINETGRVGIGTTSPAALLSVSTDDLSTAPSTDADELLLESSGNTGATILCGINQKGNIYFGEHTVGVSRGAIVYDTNTDSLAFSTNGLANERARIDSSGRLLVGTSSDSGGALLQVNGNRIRVATAKTPASATDTGTAGEICWDASYIYVCTATNTWKRAALSTW